MANLPRSPSRSWLAVAVSAAVLVVAPHAEAKCGAPQPMLAPSSRAVPPRPVLELLVPGWGVETGTLPRVIAKGAGGSMPAVTVTPDTTADALKTFRVAIGAAPAGPLQVDLLDAQGATARSWSLVVDPGWKAPVGSRATVSVRQEHSSWTCSHTSTTNLSFDGGAAAYRVVAASSVGDLAAGRTQSVVLPRAMRLFWESNASTPPPPVDVELGHANCFGNTFDWSKGAVVAQVLALQPDGTEQPVTATPIRIGPP